MFEFLVGLNRHLDDVRERILGRCPPPNVREKFDEKKTSDEYRIMGPQLM